MEVCERLTFSAKIERRGGRITGRSLSDKGAFLWDDPDQDQWSDISWIMAGKINSDEPGVDLSGFFVVLWSEWSRITDPDLDHPKGTQLKILLNTPLPLTLMVWVHCFCTTDIVERIMEHMLNSSRKRRQVVTQLVNLGVVEDRKLLRKKRKKGERKRKKDDGFVVVCQWLLNFLHYYWPVLPSRFWLAAGEL